MLWLAAVRPSHLTLTFVVCCFQLSFQATRVFAELFVFVESLMLVQLLSWQVTPTCPETTPYI
jgi:hypothetical protein